MPLPDVDRERILAALEQFDRELRAGNPWQQNANHRYAIRHSGRLYPVKQIVALATGRKVSEFISYDARRFLQKRGFSVISLRRGPPGPPPAA